MKRTWSQRQRQRQGQGPSEDNKDTSTTLHQIITGSTYLPFCDPSNPHFEALVGSSFSLSITKIPIKQEFIAISTFLEVYGFRYSQRPVLHIQNGNHILFKDGKKFLFEMNWTKKKIGNWIARNDCFLILPGVQTSRHGQHFCCIDFGSQRIT